MDFYLNKRLLIFNFIRFSMLFIVGLTPYLVFIMEMREISLSRLIEQITKHQSTLIYTILFIVLLFFFKFWVLSELNKIRVLWQNRNKPRISLDSQSFRFWNGEKEMILDWSKIQKSSYSEYTYNGIRHQAEITFILTEMLKKEQTFSLLHLSDPKEIYDNIVCYWHNL